MQEFIHLKVVNLNVNLNVVCFESLPVFGRFGSAVLLISNLKLSQITQKTLN